MRKEQNMATKETRLEIAQGPASNFRSDINTNFERIWRYSEALGGESDTKIGNWQSTGSQTFGTKVWKNDTITNKLFGNAKVFTGTEADLKAALTAGMILEVGDIWINITDTGDVK